MDWHEWFEDAWAVRAERVYRDLFGAARGGIFVLAQEIFEPFGKGEVDPRWLTHGVFSFPPNDQRGTWLFVTSGLSNAWLDEAPNPDGLSGLGCELVLETREDSRWAPFHLQRLLAFQILLGWGRYGGKEPLGVGDRIPLRNPIDGEGSVLTWCLVVPSPEPMREFRLPTGRAEFLHLVGITEAEAVFARENGYEALVEKLSGAGYPVTVAGRTSVV